MYIQLEKLGHVSEIILTKLYLSSFYLAHVEIGIWCLMPLSIIFLFYQGGQFY